MSEEARAKRYYDAFAQTYEARRDGRSRYHDLLDELEVDLALPYVRDQKVIEVGCGTGLLLRRFADVAKRAVGIDLSTEMLARARDRGLDVREGSAERLPVASATFDVAVSFKTLPHVPNLRRALAEMARVVRPGGVVIAELYNPNSMRHAIKRFLPAGRVADLTERDVLVRFDDREDLLRALPANCTVERVRGIRTVIPAAFTLRLPWVGRALERIERDVADSAFAERYGGFIAYVIRRG
jgi:ubiquinone/menaquinone biosynthesis C-methylase UbiE